MTGPRHRTVLSDFRVILPKYRGDQESSLSWLAAAHARARGEADPRRIRRLINRFACGSERIYFRNTELEDFVHQDWERMKIFGSGAPASGQGADARSRFYSEAVNSLFERFYAEETSAPDVLVHVTCTGYVSPSGAQRLVASRAWGQVTEVIHAYHMGCYAALPAAFLAQGFLSAGKKRVDVVHTELCTLHLNPAEHAAEQIVVQSLFSDGFIRYSVASEVERQPGLELLASREEIIPGTESQMTWQASDHGMSMTLARDVPASISRALPSFYERLATDAGRDPADLCQRAVFAVHPGGPRIIDQVRESLELSKAQVAASNSVLKDYGNMSSATLPHVWKMIVEDAAVPEGTPVVSFAFGPGLTFSAAIFEKRAPA